MAQDKGGETERGREREGKRERGEENRGINAQLGLVQSGHVDKDVLGLGGDLGVCLEKPTESNNNGSNNNKGRQSDPKTPPPPKRTKIEIRPLFGLRNQFRQAFDDERVSEVCYEVGRRGRGMRERGLTLRVDDGRHTEDAVLRVVDDGVHGRVSNERQELGEMSVALNGHRKKKERKKPDHQAKLLTREGNFGERKSMSMQVQMVRLKRRRV